MKGQTMMTRSVAKRSKKKVIRYCLICLKFVIKHLSRIIMSTAWHWEGKGHIAHKRIWLEPNSRVSTAGEVAPSIVLNQDFAYSIIQKLAFPTVRDLLKH